MDIAVFEDLIQRASSARQELRFAEAAEKFAVAADLAEETGHPTLAQSARNMARRALVVAWARTKWPRSDLRDGDVHIDRSESSKGGEIRYFGIYHPSTGRWTFVSVGRRGRVTEYRERRPR